MNSIRKAERERDEAQHEYDAAAVDVDAAEAERARVLSKEYYRAICAEAETKVSKAVARKARAGEALATATLAHTQAVADAGLRAFDPAATFDAMRKRANELKQRIGDGDESARDEWAALKKKIAATIEAVG